MKLKQAQHESFVLTRRGAKRILYLRKPLARWLSRWLPEILGTLGIVLFVAATWIIHPIAGMYSAALGTIGAALVVGMGRRP